MRALLQAIRPRQWVKNLFVGAPVIFAQRLTDLPTVQRAAAAVGIFCLITSAVYLWNDLIDVEKDRVHPKKRNRPIASGALSIPAARACAAAFAAIGLALGFLLDPRYAEACGAYLGLNVAYSLILKKIPYLDVMVIAAGFLLRVFAGALAVRVHPSPWLLLCTGLLAAFTGFGKRAHELAAAGARGAEQRAVLSSYHPTLLRAALVVTGLATLGAYAAYTLAEHTRLFFHTTRMWWTIPPIAVGMGRYLTLVTGRPNAESPTEEMLRDPLFVATLAVWVAGVVGIIYYGQG
jgi:decaprenyl-phosphate phosphoribosyltransferase